jgi:DNA-directed RNA polymerase I, II, and III subunit RPABC2
LSKEPNEGEDHMFDQVDDVEDGDMRTDLDEDVQKMEIIASGQKNATSKAVEKSKRITTRYMTKYERARVLGMNSQHEK